MFKNTFSGGRYWSHHVAALVLAGVVTTSWATSREVIDPLANRTAAHIAVESAVNLVEEQPQAPRALYTVGPHGNCDFSTLQAAIDSAGDGDTIRVAANGGYLGQTYRIHGKGLTIQGGFETCNLSETPSGRTTLDGNNAPLRLFDIWQTSSPPNSMEVRLENLRLRRGSGALLIEGQLGRLGVALANVEISNNSSSENGGGVRVLGLGTTAHNGTGEPLLTVSNDSLFLSNTSAGAGGAISCESSPIPGSRTSIRVGSTLMMQNSALNGGAIASGGCRHVFVYSGGPLLLIIPTGGIYLNTATNQGGGVYVTGGSTVTISSAEFGGFGNPDHAAMLASNSAASGGGAAVLGAGSELTLRGTVVSGNSASASAGGILVGDGASLDMHPASALIPCQPLQTGGGVASQPPCSMLRQNDSGSAPGALWVFNGSQAVIDRTLIKDNVAGSGGTSAGAVAMVNRNDGVANSPSTLTIESSLVTGNTGGNLLYAATGGELLLRWSTVAANVISQTVARAFSGTVDVTSSVRFTSSIVWGNSLNTLVTRGGAGNHLATADCLIGPQESASTNLTSSFAYRFIDPAFIDAAGGDFRLAPTSPAIDFCDDLYTPLTTRDLDGQLRGQAWTGPPPPAGMPALGLFDLGAYEAQLDDVIFADGFE